MQEKEKIFPELDVPQWLLDLASFFFIDLVQHLQTLNISLQGREKLISDLAQSIFTFHSKLRLFRKDLEAKTFAHLKCLKKLMKATLMFRWKQKIICAKYLVLLKK